jgi:DNA-binding response OmpR family regulator
LSKPLTILLTEGNGTLREVAARYLIRQGYHVRTASDDQAALAILATEVVHLLLLDLTSPEMNGWAVLRYVQGERRGHFPYVVVLSGVLTDDERRKVQELGADEYLRKPFLLSQLFERVQEVVHRLCRGEAPEPSS